MQRERSRSRDGRPDDADLPDEDRQPPTADEHEHPSSESEATHNVSTDPEEDFVEWQLVFTDMTADPVTLRADPSGPSLQEAALAVGMPGHEIIAAHPVPALTTSQVSFIAILQCRNDHLIQEAEVMTLFDVVCARQGASSSTDAPHLFHSVHISRTSQSLNTLTTRMFSMFPDRVTFHHNGRAWSPSDPAMYRIRHGDLFEAHFSVNDDERFRHALLDWLMEEGLTTGASVPAVFAPVEISPTLPMPSDDELPAYCECTPQQDPLPGHGFQTWYISHRRRTRCTQNRVIFFTVSPMQWRQALLNIWRDQMDPDAPFTLTWVSPQPSTDLLEPGVLPHLVIEQHYLPRRIAVVLTKVHMAFFPPLVTTAAFSVMEFSEVGTYFELMDITAHEDQRRFRCTAVCDSRPVQITRRPTGQSIVLTLHRRASTEPMEDDVTALMQNPPSTLASQEQFWIGPDTGSARIHGDSQIPQHPALPYTGGLFRSSLNRLMIPPFVLWSLPWNMPCLLINAQRSIRSSLPRIFCH